MSAQALLAIAMFCNNTIFKANCQKQIIVCYSNYSEEYTSIQMCLNEYLGIKNKH